MQNWRDWEEEEETENVEEERRIEWRDEDENSVAIFLLRNSGNWFVFVLEAFEEFATSHPIYLSI